MGTEGTRTPMTGARGTERWKVSAVEFDLISTDEGSSAFACTGIEDESTGGQVAIIPRDQFGPEETERLIRRIAAVPEMERALEAVLAQSRRGEALTPEQIQCVVAALAAARGEVEG